MSASSDSGSRDGSLRHQFSWESNSSIPMWDSSDPKRAPAPLPLHPGRASPVSNRVTSPNIAAAHEALASKARESNYVTNPPPPRSPEKGFETSLIRTAQRRMTNFENAKPSQLSPTRDRSSIYEARTPEQSPTRQNSELNLKDVLGDAPNLRPSRPASRAITGEPSPQSATMKALMARPTSSRDEWKDDEIPSQTSTPKAVNMSTAGTSTVGHGNLQDYEGLAGQITGLTTICTNLQHELTQLTRRSKDNASDLLSLRDVTNTRDEDIRKSLRELVTGLNTTRAAMQPQSPAAAKDSRPRSASPLRDAASESGLSPKRATLPRIPSLHTFSASLDGRTRPNLNIDGAPALALLEKIYDEMATKLDMAGLQDCIDEIPLPSGDKPAGPTRSGSIRGDPGVARKLEEIISLLKSGSANTENVAKKLDELSGTVKSGDSSQALVPASQYRNMTSETVPTQSSGVQSTPLSVFRGAQDRLAQVNGTQSGNLVKAHDKAIPEAVVNDEVMKLLKRINNSVFESGGLTSEIKMLLRDMRGEVLGMGRNITTKLETLELEKATALPPPSESDASENERELAGVSHEEVAEIVTDSFAELKKHFDRLHQEYRRSSNASLMSRNTVDVEHIEAVMTDQLKQLSPAVQSAIRERFDDVKDLIASTIKENWESYKPEVSIEMDGLQREEIVETIKECLQKSRGSDDESKQQEAISGATYDEVVDAVQQAMENFKMPPAPSSEIPFSKEDMLVEMKDEMQAIVSKCLEEFEFPSAEESQSRGVDFDHEEFLEAVRDEVREGLGHQGKTETMINIAEEDLINAVRVGLSEMPMGQINTEVLDRCQGLIDEMKAEFKQYSSANGRDTEQVLDALSDGHAKLVESFKTGMDGLRTDIESYVDRSQDVTGKDEIIDEVRQCVERIGTDLEGMIANIPQPSPSVNNTAEILEGMEKEFEHLRITLTNVMRSDSSSPGGREELLDAIRDGFDELKLSMPKALPSTEAVTEPKDDSLDPARLSELLAGILDKSGKNITQEEMRVLIREVVEESSASSSREIDGGSASNTEELLTHFNEALDRLKTDYEKVSKRTQDSNTITYDVLETLKSGVSSIRADIDRLAEVHKDRRGSESTERNGAVVVADPETAAKALEKNDIEKLEVMINQLKTQVDGIPTNRPSTSNSASASASTEEDVKSEADSDPLLRAELVKISDLVMDLQVSIEGLVAKDNSPAENAATKEDTDAIETLLLNTKAALDDMKIPESIATAESIEELHKMLQSTRDVVDDLAMRSESDLAGKQDISSVEALVKELQTGVEELRSKTGDSSLSKDDIGGIELLCDDIKLRLDGLVKEDEPLSTRNDVEALSMAVKEFQEKFEVEIVEIATALGSRKTEHGEMTDKIEEIRAFMETVRDDLKAQLESRKEELENVTLSVNTIGEKISGESDGEKEDSATRELHETVTREFERAHGDREEMKVGLEQHRDELVQRHEEHRDAVITELGVKIDEKFTELLTRFEDTVIAADGKATTLEETSKAQADAVLEAKSIAEELKISIDALAPTVTKACDEMVVDSKAAFSQIASVGERIDDGIAMLSGESKGEHGETRSDIAKAQATLVAIQARADEYNPKILSAIAEVLERVSQQHEETRRSAEEIKHSVSELPSSLPALPAPSPEPQQPVSPPEKYDDTEVQIKLDQLIELSAEAGKASAQSDVLEQIQTQVAGTAAGLEAFMRSQQAFNERQEMIAIEAAESKAREVEETNIILEKRIAQKEAVESDIIRLMEEKTSIGENVEELMQQEKDLTNLKMKMQAELRGIETALQIRREEMFAMEKRAQDLHNHILNSVIDSSRAALKTTRPKATLKEVKRVPSEASDSTVTNTKKSSVPRPTATPTGSVLSQGVSMALKKRGSTPRSGASTPSGGRRILSLSTIGANKAAADKAMVLNNPVLASTAAVKNTGGGLKRSHSVKSNFPTRKTSWGGTKQPGLYADSVLEEDKENSIYEDDEDVSTEGGGRESMMSKVTDRRSSYAGTYDGAASQLTASQVGEEEDDDDAASFVSSSVARFGLHESELARHNEQEEEAEEYEEDGALAGQGKPGGFMPTDSGIGTELHTAGLTAPSEYTIDE